MPLPAVWTEADRARFAAVCARLESPFDGERAAAGLLASKLLRQAGATWSEALAPTGVAPGRDPEPAPRTAPMPESRPTMWAWQGHAEALLAHRRADITAWEQEFLQSLLDTFDELTPKQLSVVRRLWMRAKRAE